ncbi:MAG: M1 family metallopeptidase [Nocardioidaceae bacterium]
MRRRLFAAVAIATAVLLPGGDLAGMAGTVDSSALKVEAAARAAYGIGDPYYPADGNPGYNVVSYHVVLDYFTQHETIKAITIVRSTAKQRLSSFHLDLKGLRVGSVSVDGRPATWARRGEHELVVTPAHTVRAGEAFATRVSYRGRLRYVLDAGDPSGWSSARTPGSGYIAGEPHGCAVWYPCNDHPTDKARFSLNATVPRPLAVVSNGRQGHTTRGAWHGVKVRTFRWRLGERTATYMTTMYIDKLTFERSRLADGTRVVSSYGPKPGRAPKRESRLPEILRVLGRRWGPYPAPQAGGIFVSDSIPYELETYTRPVYSRSTNLITIVHENGHQWWGDNVALHRWRDICLNECLASYSEWLWDEHNGANLDHRYRHEIKKRGDNLFTMKLYDMGPNHEFDSAVYVKGKFFVHALRNKVGDRRFFSAMRGVQHDFAGGNISMNRLRNQIERRTGADLRGFWRQWVYQTDRPSDANLFPGAL